MSNMSDPQNTPATDSMSVTNSKDLTKTLGNRVFLSFVLVGVLFMFWDLSLSKHSEIWVT